MIMKDARKLNTCPHCLINHFKKNGYYYRKVSKTYIPRYFCFNCKKYFSTRTVSKTFKQKRPDLNIQVFHYLTSGVSLRRTAQKLNCHYQTVYRKFLWLSKRAQLIHAEKEFFIKELQFDEMESIEHTKLKPLSIALAISENYQILGVKVGSIPAKGHLSEISRKKYGPRLDESPMILRHLLSNLKVRPKAQDFLIKSDSKPSYNKIIKEIFPEQLHQTHIAAENKEKKREAKHTSLEKRIFDPIFALNQRMAKLRDHIKRLTRRSWCTTKIKENLERHIYLYIADNNGYQLV